MTLDNIRKSQLFGWLGGAAALAVVALLVVGTLGSGGVHAQEGGATYTGPIDTLTAECGGGTVSLILSDDGSSVSQLVLSGVTIGGVAVDTLSDPPGGPFIVDVALAISGGSFDGAFQPLEGVDAVAEGTFDGDSVSGSFGVEALACVDVTYTATKVEAVNGDASMPISGTGPMSDSGLSFYWALAAGTFGIASLAIGAAVRRRVRVEAVNGDATLPTSGTGPPSDFGLSLGWALAAGAFGIASLAVGAAVRRRVR